VDLLLSYVIYQGDRFIQMIEEILGLPDIKQLG
jgi:hypothetical protein